MKLVYRGRYTPLVELVSEEVCFDVESWQGRLGLFCPGKAGELIFLSGFIEDFRRTFPKAHLHLRTLAKYKDLPIISRYDSSSFIEAGGSSAADFSSWLHRNSHGGFQRFDGDLAVDVYRAHWWFANDNLYCPGWFVSSFAHAVGLRWNKPILSAAPNGLVVAIPKMNKHASWRGYLPISSDGWDYLAQVVREQGLLPVAIGDPVDGSGELPGWEWRDTNLEQSCSLLFGASFIIAGQSGLPLSALLCADVPGVIIDESLTRKFWEQQKRPWADYPYDPRQTDLWDTHKHLYLLPNNQDILDRDALERIGDLIISSSRQDRCRTTDLV